MGLFDFFTGGEDNPLDLVKEAYANAYRDPWLILSLDSAVGIDVIRDRFRQMIYPHNTEFVGNQMPKQSFEQVVLAYRLCTGELKGPAKKLKIELETNRLFVGLTPDHFIPWLRPLHCSGMDHVHPEVRAAKALHISYVGFTPEVQPGSLPYFRFTFRVHYCLRITEIKVRYSECEKLHLALMGELLILPGFPEKNILLKFGVGDMAKRAEDLAEYIMNIHECLGARGVFSPRIMEFLQIDYARVHYEEEGRWCTHILDTVGLMQGSQWQVICEQWLRRWRKFIMSRGARRYFPPGKICNECLLKKDKDGTDKVTEKKKNALRLRLDLKPVKHYRSINFNVWWYLYKVYGGGPEITRKGREITSPAAIGRLQAIYRIQAIYRGYLARCHFTRQYLHQLAITAPGVQEVLKTRKEQETKELADKKIKEAKQGRKEKILTKAAEFTQRQWRERKGYASGSTDELKVRKHIQEVFARVAGSIEEAMGGQPLVVEDVLNILTVGDTQDYIVTIEKPIEGNKLPIKFGKHPNSEASIVNFRNPEYEFVDKVKPRSILLAINGYPVNSLTHQQKMDRLAAARFPLKLLLKRPLEKEDVLKLSEIISIESKDVRLNELKRKLWRGVTVLKFGRKGKPHATRLAIDELWIYWEGKNRKDPRKKAQKALSLFEVRWAAQGKKTAVFKTKYAKDNKKYPWDLCFSIAAEKRTLDFFVQNDVGDDGQANGGEVLGKIADNFYDNDEEAGSGEVNSESQRDGKEETKKEDPTLAELRCTLLVWGFKKIIEEIKSVQHFVDKDGNPIKRKIAKKQLTAIKI